MAGKSAHAFKTIGELASDLGVPQHMLRYWETRFPQLRPLQRAGNRRYYRPDDVALARRIHALLTHEGYTIRGVQRVLGDKEAGPARTPPTPGLGAAKADRSHGSLREIRERLADALAESAA